ncbi:MAG: hypothetical protein RL385_4411, partial [Pseudomonadota bacterium]
QGVSGPANAGAAQGKCHQAGRSECARPRAARGGLRSGHEVDLTLRCGKGFYVRSLARDLAHALGTVGHLTQLRRLENAGFRTDDAVSFDVLLRAAKLDPALRVGIRDKLLPLPVACLRLPHVHIPDEGIAHLRHGRPWEVPASLKSSAPDHAELIGIDETGVPRAILRVEAGCFRVQRGLNAD